MQLLLPEVQYLRMIMDADGIRPITTKLFDKMHLKTPNTIRQVRRLIGLIDWFRPNLPNLSTKMVLLTNLTKKVKHKNSTINWDENLTRLVDEIFDEIKQANKLYYPDISKNFELHTDASDVGIGSILRQEVK